MAQRRMLGAFVLLQDGEAAPDDLAGLDAGWEMDFVGGLRRRVEAASASVEATREIYHDTMVLVYAEVATA